MNRQKESYLEPEKWHKEKIILAVEWIKKN